VDWRVKRVGNGRIVNGDADPAVDEERMKEKEMSWVDFIFAVEQLLNSTQAPPFRKGL
jgi:hypothetical protein